VQKGEGQYVFIYLPTLISILQWLS